MIPVFVAVYYLPDAWLSPVGKNWTAMTIFAVAAITDWLDGYLARRWGETSAFGAFLDPVADKLMVAAALILLVQLGRAEAYLAIIIIGREIAISALREMDGAAREDQERRGCIHRQGEDGGADDGDHRAPAVGARIPGVPTPLLGSIALWVAAILTLWSMFHYLRLAAPHLRQDGTTEIATTVSRPDDGR